MNILSLKKSQKGLTIIELLIAIPIATIILVVIMAAFFIQYTNVLAESSRTTLRTSGQALLINLQDELLFTIAYGETLETSLTDPHQPTGGWTNDSSPFETLIINEIALDSTRRDDNRNIIRQLINPCESSGVTSNPVAINNVIYFVEKPTGENFGTLYKRTIVPTYDLCSIDRDTGDPCTPESTTCLGNAKATTCPEGQVGNNDCVAVDQALTENVVDFQITYFAKDNVETAFPSAANKVEIDLTLGDKVYGKDVQAKIKHTIRKIN